MAFKLAIDNPDGLTGAIEALTQVASESVLRQATVAGARVIFEEVKLRTPVGIASWESRDGKQKRYPGFLRDNILLAFDKERSAEGIRATYLVTWSKEAFYGRWVEYGNSKMGAQAFLRPAYEATREAAAQKFSDVIDEKVRELTSVQ